MYVYATKPILIQDIEQNVILDIDSKNVENKTVYEVPGTDIFMKQVKKGVLVMTEAPKTQKKPEVK